MEAEMLVTRRGVDAVVTCVARLMLRVFFREIELGGIERLPRGVPLVIASNHTNSVVDGVLLLALPGVRPRLLAKSTLWSHPFMRPLLVLVGALHVCRRQDPGVDMTGNRALTARTACAGGEAPGAGGGREARGAASPPRLGAASGVPRATPPPLAAVFLTWPPSRSPGGVPARLSTTPDEPATYKLLAG